MTEERKIKTRFSTRCRDCGEPITKGLEVFWLPGFGVRCVDEDNCSAARDAQGDDPFDYWGQD